MSASTEKKFNRWLSRLQDKNSEVKDEAVRMLVEVANEDAKLKDKCLDALASHFEWIADQKGEYQAYWNLRSIENLNDGIFASSDKLMSAVLMCPTNDDTICSQLMMMLRDQIEGGNITSSHKYANKVHELAKKISGLSHGGGKKYALHICDWCEDNL